MSFTHSPPLGIAKNPQLSANSLNVILTWAFESKFDPVAVWNALA